MPIRARVGRHTRAGGRECQNRADDQKTVIDLLNRIPATSGGVWAILKPVERCSESARRSCMFGSRGIVGRAKGGHAYADETRWTMRRCPPRAWRRARRAQHLGNIETA